MDEIISDVEINTLKKAIRKEFGEKCPEIDYEKTTKDFVVRGLTFVPLEEARKILREQESNYDCQKSSETVLGKIEEVDVKLIRGCFLGIDFTFSLNGGSRGICSGGKYTINVSKECKYDGVIERNEAYAKGLEYISRFLKEAKVDRVQQLKNLPVEVTIENKNFKDFRILTEVL